MCTLRAARRNGGQEGWAERWYLTKAARSTVDGDLGDERQVIRG
jgi:hypothetical protein